MDAIKRYQVTVGAMTTPRLADGLSDCKSL